MSATEADFIAVTTQARTKRHWSSPDYRTPHTCCGHTAYTQQEITDMMPPRWRKRVVIADLPPCLQCDKSKARRIAGRPS
jgi:hypothetical protein